MADPLRALAALFAPDDPTLAAKVDRAKHDRWQAMIAGLAARRRAVTIDWKTFPSGVLWALDRILPKDRTRWAWCDLDAYEGTTTTRAFLRVVGRALAAANLGLVGLDDDSDSHVLALVPFGEVARARRLARAARGRIESFAPRTKPAPPRPLPARPPSPPTKRARQFRVRGDLCHGHRLHARGMVFTTGDGDRGLQLADHATWPPVVRALTPRYAQLAWGDDRTFATYTSGAVAGVEVATIVRRDGARATTTIAGPPGVGIGDLQFVEGKLVLFPASFAYRAGVATTPLQRVGTRWVPLPGLPRAVLARRAKGSRFDRLVLQGLARTGDGRDVILWNERGYEWTGGAWVATFALGRCTPSDEVATVPVVDGFVFVDGGRLKRVVRGKPARHVLPKELRVEWACAGPRGSIVCCVIRATSKDPAGVIYLPDRHEYAAIPAAAFSLRGDRFLDTIAYEAALDLVIGIVDSGGAPVMAPVHGASLLTLPRVRAQVIGSPA